MNQPADRFAFSGSRAHPISADEFWRMIDAGVFTDMRVELVDGELIEMAPSGRPHGALVARLTRLIGNAYGDDDWLHFSDTYIGLAPNIVRAPDICVVDRHQDEGAELTGADVFLAIEVSHSTLKEDLEVKRLHYAASGIRHYWVVDVEGRRVHCFAQPVDGDYGAAVVTAFGVQLDLPGCAAGIVVE